MDVTVVLFDGAVLFDLGTALQVFREAVVCAERRGPLRTSRGVLIEVEHGLEAVERADLVIVPGIAGGGVADHSRALDALRLAHARGARVMSICTGAFALAHAGLLDGRRATTHWAFCDKLAERFPAVRVEPDVLYVDDGDVLTSAGLAAGMDLCLHVVRSEHGAEAANAIARWNVVAPHREGGQAQFIEAPVANGDGGGLASTRAWVLERLADPLDIPALARHAHMSERTFARRFKLETGETPKRWLLAQRVQHARRLLETTDLDVEEVAARAGFGSATSLRVHFRRATATRPSAYRSTFRGSERGGA